jgi:hypothetical protein
LLDLLRGDFNGAARETAYATIAEGDEPFSDAMRIHFENAKRLYSQKLLPLLAESDFLAAFNAKAEHADLVRRMPVAVVTESALGLRGAACLAKPYA